METMQLEKIPFVSRDWFNYDTFTRGKEVARGEYLRCDYWHGSNAIRETSKYFYLLVTGSTVYNRASIFCHNVFCVEKSVLAGVDLAKLVDELNRMTEEENDPREKSGALVEMQEDEF